MQANVWGQGTDQGLLGNGERGGKEVGAGGALEVVDVLPFLTGAMFSQVQREIQRDPSSFTPETCLVRRVSITPQ